MNGKNWKAPDPVCTMYAKKMRKGLERGTAYYKDAECTILHGVDPYKRIRVSHPVIFGCVPYWCEIVSGSVVIK